ncbi:MAG: hypothetical protein E6H95_00855 [Chloroflexi bacterium]|nr:MAG: hypothetical protein E6H95_00855 [Chloroflexota bacterium]
MKRTNLLVGLAYVMVAAACGSNQPAARTTPSPQPLPPAISSPSPSPSPPPPQRQEPALPAPVEETGAAAAGGSLYVMGGFNAAGASLDSVYVFDGSAWSAGPRLPLAVDHPSAATLDDRVYLSGGHSNGRDSARVFRLDSDHWTELARSVATTAAATSGRRKPPTPPTTPGRYCRLCPSPATMSPASGREALLASPGAARRPPRASTALIRPRAHGRACPTSRSRQAARGRPRSRAATW